MAFTTEFVMGAGGAEVEEVPVSTSVTNSWSSILTVTPTSERTLVVITGTVSGVGLNRYIQIRINGQVSQQLGNGHASHAYVVASATTVDVWYSTVGSAQFNGDIYVARL